MSKSLYIFSIIAFATSAFVFLYLNFAYQPDQAGQIRNYGSAVMALAFLAHVVVTMRRDDVQKNVPTIPEHQTASIGIQEYETLQKKYEEVVGERDVLKQKNLDAEKIMRERVASAGRDDVIGLMGLLQEKGRLLDFIMDDVAPYSDQQIGSAARVVHSGCSAVIKEYFRIAPVFAGTEGTKATVDAEAAAGRYRLMGKLKGDGPFTGTVIHRGWQTDEVRLPERVGTHIGFTGVIAPAELEIS